MQEYGDRVVAALGGGRVGGWRSPEEQDELFRQGKTPLRGGESAHNSGTKDDPGAIDISRIGPGREAEVKAIVERESGKKIKKIIWETGRGKNQGTAPHYHIEFGDGSTQQVAQSSGGGAVPNPIQVPDVRAIAATTGERAAMNEPRKTEVVNPFDVGPRLQESARDTQTRQLTLDETIQNAINQRNMEQERELEALRSRNAQQAAIREQTAAQANEALTLAQPIFQKKRAIADRLSEIADMSPFERMIKGTFDPNYNIDVLTSKDRLYSANLDAIAQHYEYNSSLQNAMIQMVASEYQSESDVFELLQSHRIEDIQLLGSSIGASSARFEQVLKELDGEVSVINAQNFAISDTVARLTPGQLNEAEQASVDGYTTINGMRIPTTLITERIDALQTQEYNLVSRKLAIDSANQAIAEQAEENILGTMTREEVDAAIKANGMWKGQQFDIAKLAQRQQLFRQIRAGFNEDNMIAETPKAVAASFRSLGQTTANILTRAGSLGIYDSVPIRAIQNDLTQLATEFKSGLERAKASGVQEEYMATFLPRFEDLRKRQAQLIESAVTNWAGKNEDLKNLGNAWLMGQPLNNRDSARGLIVLARDGLPPGMKLQGPALEAFRAAESVVTQSKAPKTGQSLEEIMNPKKGPKDGITDDMIESVLGVARDAYNGSLVDKAIQSAPEIARNIKDAKGNAHAFSLVRPQDYRTALAIGDDKGLTRIADDMGIDKPTLNQILAGGPQGRAWTTWAQGREGAEADFSYWTRQLVALQTQETLIALDSTASATHDFKPSEAWADLMGSPEFQQQVYRTMDNQRNSGFGDFVVSGAAGNSANQQFGQYAAQIPIAQQTYASQKVIDTTARVAELRGDPYKRLSVIISAIPGVNREDENRLIQAVRLRLPEEKYLKMQDVKPRQRSHEIDSLILNERFEDPTIEAIRKRVAKHYETFAPQADTMFERIFGD